MSDTLPPLSVFGMIAAIASIVLGAIGAIGSLASLIGTMTTVGSNLFMMFGMEQFTYTMMWGAAASVLGFLIHLLGLVLSIGAVGGGIFALVKKSIGPVIGIAVLMVLLDLLCHVIWPWIVMVITVSLTAMETDWEMAMITGGVGVFGLIIGTIWSVVVTVLWAVVAGFGIQERRQAGIQVLD